MSSPSQSPQMASHSPECRTPLSGDLNSLRICLRLDPNARAGSNRRGIVQIDVAVAGQQIALLECSTDEIHLPANVNEARTVQSNDGAFTLPDHILRPIGEAFSTSAVPLWLSFPSPSGYLPGLPWESLLRPALKIPSILKLSYQAVQPITPRDSRDILLCFSFARAKETYLKKSPEQILDEFFTNFPPNIAAYTTFHLFTDVALFPHAKALSDRYQGDYRMQVYDPQSAARFGVAQGTSEPDDASDPVDNPWLLWMRDALGTCSVDVVHFVAHGYLGRQDGFIALSESPLVNDDQQIARFVGARQICAFLGQVGAWSVAFSSPPGNYSVLALRMLQDQISRVRPGPVLFHDIDRDPYHSGLHEAYQFAYAVEEAYPPNSTAISLSCHPEWAMPWTEGDVTSRRLLDELTLSGRMSEVFEGRANTPSWLASGQRALESSLAELLASSPGDPERVLTSGAADALRFTADLLEKHAQKLNFETKQVVK